MKEEEVNHYSDLEHDCSGHKIEIKTISFTGIVAAVVTGIALHSILMSITDALIGAIFG